MPGGLVFSTIFITSWPMKTLDPSAERFIDCWRMPVYCTIYVHASAQSMPLLAPIGDLDFCPKAHRYRYKGQWLSVSVTAAISDLSDTALKHIEATRHVWEPRGNAVHSALEKHLLQEQPDDCSDYQEWIEPMLDCWLWKGSDVMGVEMRLVDPVKMVAGSTDFILRTQQGTLVIGDLKTVGSSHAVKSRKPADAQLGAYTSMLAFSHPNIVIEKCATVVSGPGICVVKDSDPRYCIEAWEDAWMAYQAKQELLLGF